MDKRLLVVNLHFAPHRFGGGTVVAEACSRDLHRNHGWQVLVLTTIRDFNMPEYSLRRYRFDGMDVVAVVVHSEPDYLGDYSNPRFDAVVRDVLAAYRPTVCHAHALQGLGVGWFPALREYGCRLAVTLHDCWWLCDRQFMINSDGRYCNQQRIDRAQCQYCTASIGALRERDRQLRDALQYVDRLLYPSEFHRRLHVASGFPEATSQVNGNGICLPGEGFDALRRRSRAGGGKTVFGFTGGPGEIKGAALMLSAFEQAGLANYSLRVVDAAQNLGTSWRSSSDWRRDVKVDFVSAYTMETMDTFFAGIDVLLFPSQWKESFGLTVREALARDVWVIATDCGAPVENIVDGENGRLVPFDSGPRELAAALVEAAGRDWADYRNPYKGQLRSFASQSAELDEILRGLLE
ncbi:glycosyltransferase family 4 protein [Haliea sp. E17]|uniref:glycosyltransferase family 4 protein n=1 Tax=Haliea sp. E17 TaxID=3401576 RepID=UPI003AAFBC99